MKLIMYNSIINICEYVGYVVGHHRLFYSKLIQLYNQIKYQMEAKIYLCPICERRCEHKATLKVHVTNHTVIAPLFLISYSAIHLQLEYKLGFVVYINNVIIVMSSISYVLLYTNRDAHCLNNLLCWYVSSLCTIIHINGVIYMYVLCKWYRVCLRCRCFMTNGCGSPLFHEASHRCYLFLYITVVLCCTGAFRLATIMLSICIKHIPDLIFTCLCHYTDVNYEQNADVFPLIGAFRIIRSGTSLGYNLFYHLKWLLIII